MRLLSFDIECAKAYKNYSPICNFGYVIYDEDFCLIEKKDIVINPKSKFKLEGRKGRDDIKLFYSEEKYKKSKPFYDVYPVIKNLLEKEDQIILNHAVRNDIVFLNNDCRRYHLPMINFKAYDSMDIYKALNNYKGSIGLEKILHQFNAEDNLNFHKADDDANGAMIYFIESCKLLGLKANEIIEAANLKPILSISLKEKPKKEKNNNQIISKEIMAISRYLENKKISFSLAIQNNSSKYENIIYSVKQLGGSLTKKVSESCIFIFDEKSHCKRCDSFIINNENGKEITGYKYDDFMSIAQEELVKGLKKQKNCNEN